VVQGRLCGMVQGKAPPGSHGLLPVLRAALRPLGAAPARSRPALAQRLGVSEAKAASGGVPLEAVPAPVVPAAAAASVAPLVPMTAPHGGSSAPQTLRHRAPVRAARQRTTP
jgi:hypothetical protein